MKKNEIIKLENISKKYYLKNKVIEVLENLNITFEKNKFYAIMGPSGSGKTTLINILGLLDKQTNGVYYINGRETTNLSDKELSILRNRSIGFIFQDFYLDDNLTALENVLMPLIINKDLSKEKSEEKAKKLLKELGLENRLNHYPSELSGGEKERVSIARALVNEPDIIIADEATGNLDEDLEKEVFKILKDLSRSGKCVIAVSHSNKVKDYVDVTYNLKDKKLV